MSQKLTPLSCKKIEGKLRNLGFVLDHTDSSSIRYYRKQENGKTYVVQVHFHPTDRGIPVINNILRTGNISRADWLKA